MCFGSVDLFIQAGGKMLHFEESLVDKRLAFPRVYVLPDQSISYQLKQFFCWQRDVVPSLTF